ncbi:uncharacterized protein LOC124414489 [Diprion similis]|uniref:uncharacterized protein LOC124414489 n=1 Tax=Diprion similis TaxID=362088 RepID=UPI001EF97A02|nr:uncharacterized protein LOC124414489 [Diprion similis]
MERRSVSDLISQFEPLLRRFEDDDGLVITEATEEAGCKVGDNYMSVVMRATVKGSRGNGTSYAKSIVTKYLPHHREITLIFRTADLFKNESYFYERLLPLFGDLGPTCIHADGDKILMEDLKHLGYSVLERRELLDLDHSLATVRILGRLHASSLALKLRDPQRFEELVSPLTEAIFPQDTRPSLGVSINDCVKIAVAQLQSIEPKSEELEIGIQFLKSFGESVYSEVQKLVVPGQGEFDVLTHGDCWNNNIMFKHDNAGRVVDVKLVDFQITRHVSPAVDFHYFVYSSPKSSVVEDNYDDLVQAYHSAFAETLERKSVPLEARQRLSLEWFNDELRKCAKYGIFTACWIIQAILAEEQDTVNMDHVTIDFMKDFMNRHIQVKPKVAERLKCLLVHYVRRYKRNADEVIRKFPKQMERLLDVYIFEKLSDTAKLSIFMDYGSMNDKSYLYSFEGTSNRATDYLRISGFRSEVNERNSRLQRIVYIVDLWNRTSLAEQRFADNRFDNKSNLKVVEISEITIFRSSNLHAIKLSVFQVNRIWKKINPLEQKFEKKSNEIEKRPEKAAKTMDLQFLQQVLRKWEKDSRLELTSVNETPACGLGINFMSVVNRICAKGKRGDGSPYEVSLITKKVLDDECHQMVFKSFEIFLNEVKAYKALSHLLGENQKLIPNCLHAEDDLLILEDMKDQGFTMLDKRKGLDIDHAILVMKALAEFHAASLILEYNEPEKYSEIRNEIREVLFPPDGDHEGIKAMITALPTLMMFYLKVSATPEDDHAKEMAYFEDKSEKMYNMLKEIIKPKKFAVMCAGDCWITNLLFKYKENNNDSRSVSEVRLLDFQGARFASVAIDVLYFLHTSVDHMVIEERLEDLLQAYHTVFISRLSSIPEKTRDQLSIEWLRNELKTHELYGFFMALWIAPATTLNEEHTIDGVTVASVSAGNNHTPEYMQDKLSVALLTKVHEKCKYFLK